MSLVPPSLPEGIGGGAWDADCRLLCGILLSYVEYLMYSAQPVLVVVSN